MPLKRARRRARKNGEIITKITGDKMDSEKVMLIFII
jgi:hypothetical protein